MAGGEDVGGEVSRITNRPNVTLDDEGNNCRLQDQKDELNKNIG